ncbi:MAG: molybdopterin molybdotransferase MoeA [Bacteroidia bacterium]|nr:molybdopterin molybdotransferase MoeA [Bacteroidia bacterium]
MVDVQLALKTVLQNPIDLGDELVPLEFAVGKILAEDIRFDRSLPPFNRVCMDGIAINHQAIRNGQKTFQIEKVIAAGDPEYTLLQVDHCVEIMTGAVLPKNTDTVIRYEDLGREKDGFTILAEIRQGANIHNKGTDFSKDEVLLKKHLKLKPVDINILASVGMAHVKVKKMPTVALISSGNELIPVHLKPEDHQIRISNIHMLKARLTQLGIKSSDFHFKDEKTDIREKLLDIMKSYDVILMSGGVSKGKFDFIPGILDELGFNKLFHGVKQRPGKPMWFGRRDNNLVFAFPGNPVSSLACLHKYFIPWLNTCLKQDLPLKLKVKLAKDVDFKPDLHYFAQASLSIGNDGVNYATVSHGNGSGDIVNPSGMDGFVEFPRGSNRFLSGEIFNFIPFHPIYS